MTWYVTNREQYLEDLAAVGRAYRDVIGKHFPGHVSRGGVCTDRVRGIGRNRSHGGQIDAQRDSTRGLRWRNQSPPDSNRPNTHKRMRLHGQNINPVLIPQPHIGRQNPPIWPGR
ncbi:MAG: hypothetical protein CM15mP125_1060 [Gammaproteobacteria bacterium]|nr:MAG: hypothetical protein CM15mP125_1060 [Gammaproteobacteria bacterium]